MFNNDMHESFESNDSQDVAHFGERNESNHFWKINVIYDYFSDLLALIEDIKIFNNYLLVAMVSGALTFTIDSYFISVFPRNEQVDTMLLGIFEKLFFSIAISSKMAAAFQHIETFEVYDELYNVEVIDNDTGDEAEEGKEGDLREKGVINEFSQLKQGIVNNVYWSMAGLMCCGIIDTFFISDEIKNETYLFSVTFLLKIFPYLTPIDVSQYLIAHKKYSWAAFPLFFYATLELLVSAINTFFEKNYFVEIISKTIIAWISFLAFISFLRKGAEDEKKCCMIAVKKDENIKEYIEFYNKDPLTIAKLFKAVFSKQGISPHKNSFILHFLLAITNTLNSIPNLMLAYTMSHKIANDILSDELYSVRVPFFAMQGMSIYLGAVALLGSILFRQLGYAFENGYEKEAQIKKSAILYTVYTAIPIVIAATLMFAHSSQNDLAKNTQEVFYYAAWQLLLHSANHVLVTVHRGLYNFSLPIISGLAGIIAHGILLRNLPLNSEDALGNYYKDSTYIYISVFITNMANYIYLLLRSINKINLNTLFSGVSEGYDLLMNSCKSLTKCGLFSYQASTEASGEQYSNNHGHVPYSNMEHV